MWSECQHSGSYHISINKFYYNNYKNDPFNQIIERYYAQISLNCCRNSCSDYFFYSKLSRSRRRSSKDCIDSDSNSNSKCRKNCSDNASSSFKRCKDCYDDSSYNSNSNCNPTKNLPSRAESGSAAQNSSKSNCKHCKEIWHYAQISLENKTRKARKAPCKARKAPRKDDASLDCMNCSGCKDRYDYAGSGSGSNFQTLSRL